MHRSRNVCFEGKKGSCDSGRFRDGRCQGNEEGIREEHVVAKALEIESSYEATEALKISKYRLRFVIEFLTSLGLCLEIY